MRKKPTCPFCNKEMIPSWIEIENGNWMLFFTCNCEGYLEVEQTAQIFKLNRTIFHIETIEGLPAIRRKANGWEVFEGDVIDVKLKEKGKVKGHPQVPESFYKSTGAILTILSFYPEDGRVVLAHTGGNPVFLTEGYPLIEVAV